MTPVPVLRSRPSSRKSSSTTSSSPLAADASLPGCNPPSLPKALFIVVSEYPDPAEYKTLTTVLKDLETLRAFLVDEKRFRLEDICILRCGDADPKLLRTKDNIEREIDKLVGDTRPGDFRLFYHAGHVVQRPTNSLSEEDGLDEAMVTVDEVDKDHPANNLVFDNELRIRLVNGMGEGSMLVAILEGCHSATLLDLDTPRRYLKVYRTLSGDIQQRKPCHQRLTAVRRGRMPSRRSSGQTSTEIQDVGFLPRTASPEVWGGYRTDDDFAHVISISACLDHQESNTNEKTMVHFLVELLSSHEMMTPRELEKRLTDELVEEKVRFVCAYWARKHPDQILSKENVERIRTRARELQNPKVSTLRGYTYLLEQQLSIPTAPS